MNNKKKGALSGVRVLDFSTLLPGPLASLLLAEAGAEVIKVERPDFGDELRVYPPPFGGWGFALLNRGKKSLSINLKDGNAKSVLAPLIEEADVLLEQFRPGVMARLGLGYESAREINPALVYCSVTGYGQSGPRAAEVGHDLNYQAASGLLSLGGDSEGKPTIAPGLIADIGGGTLPAVVNILLALRQAEQTGEGCHLDVSMTDNLLAWSWWAQAARAGGLEPEVAGRGVLTGGSPRYQLYATSDGRYLAVAALEERFWVRFCDLIGLPKEIRELEAGEASKVGRAVASIIASRCLADWRDVLAGEDVCVAPVLSIQEAMDDPGFHARGLFTQRLRWQGVEVPALPVPLDAAVRTDLSSGAPPDLDANDDVGFEPRLPKPGVADRMPAKSSGDFSSARTTHGREDDEAK
ncbi:CoA transferase [Limibacillus sp. MBR-115]|jgi:crotonobetainyl-CoA:carnitine CoA-transferase CaiB-like acyl-CoA transferase|uniref:CaiB/BaiF CoA transferase family protein n=1 Tax=Limibacillus sp. MBR-115 TaxID=3156465 RepID=UPI003392853A